MTIMFGAFIMIFLAEMGDKSQLMAFSLATKYRVTTVLAGVFFATLINNGVAIFLGTYFGELINMEIVKAGAGILFLCFGAWTLFEKREKAEKVTVKGSFGSFMSVVLLFMVAEMGDKTQIASAVYAATYNAPFLTLAGVLAGMLLADALGIYLGLRLRDCVSIAKVKVISSIVFFSLGCINFMSSELIPLSFFWLLLVFYIIVFSYYYYSSKSVF